MSQKLRYTLITDGSSDKVLLNIIKWLLDDLYPKLPNKGTFADFSGLQQKPKTGDIDERIGYAQKYYPYDLLIYHRDAETTDKNIVQKRKNEVLKNIKNSNNIGNTVCIVPVVMMESWLLIDEIAIKKAAGNKNYKENIVLPPPKKLETLNEPKKILHELLKTVSGLKGRNLAKFNVNYSVHLIAENITDFSVLRELNAFRVFEADLKDAVNLFLSLQNK